MPQLQFQIVSDLHLETPKARPSYEEFEIKPQCPCLALLGDIGNVSDARLFDFLNRQLQQFEAVFYLLGNHELYGLDFSEAQAKVRAFEAAVEQQRRSPYDSSTGRFVFLNRTRYDITEDLTVLGCTLFSNIIPEQQNSVARFVSDFSNVNEWTVESHNAAHQADLQWLNAQVSQLAQEEPHRSILVFTHFSPTALGDANDPKQVQDEAQIRSAFTTDLSDQVCWTTPQVELWAFGHTHFNCDFEDPQTKKRIVANQKGYRRAEAFTFSHTKVVGVDVGAHLKRSGLEMEQGHQPGRSKRDHCVTS